MKLKTIPGNEIPKKASPHYFRKRNFLNKSSGKAIIGKLIPGISVQPLASQLHARKFQAISSNSNPGNAFLKKGRHARQFQASQFQGRQFRERQFQSIAEKKYFWQGNGRQGNS